MTHQKRLSAPDSWPVERKNQVYTVGSHAGPHGGDAVPLVVFVRDVLGYVESAKELRYALDNDGVVVNGEAVSDHKLPVGTFDIVAFPARDEYYRVFPGEGGRLSLVSVEEDAADNKLARVDDVRHVGGGDVQLNLHNGDNVVVEDGDNSYSTNDSVVVDLETNEILERFAFEEGSAVTAVDGRHSGEVGELVEYNVNEGSSDNTVVAELPDGTTFETVEEYVFVIGEDVESLEEQEEREEREREAETETEEEEEQGQEEGEEEQEDEEEVEEGEEEQEEQEDEEEVEEGEEEQEEQEDEEEVEEGEEEQEEQEDEEEVEEGEEEQEEQEDEEEVEEGEEEQEDEKEVEEGEEEQEEQEDEKEVEEGEEEQEEVQKEQEEEEVSEE